MPLTFDDSGRLEIGGVELVQDVSPPPRRPSQPNSFTLVKTSEVLAYYQGLTRHLGASGILELGIYQGGSFVYLDKLFQPDAISAVDIAREPVQPLVEYAAALKGRFLHFGASQTDEALLRDVVRRELNGRLDLVVDDASHRYDFSRRSFEILFPLLRPGGVYVVEDWAWSHQTAHQQPGSPWFSHDALTNLIFELVALLGSSGLLKDLYVTKGLFAVTKSERPTATAGGTDFWQRILNRDRPMPRV
jgi:predicted O-methyltransferase YrrM